MLDLLNYLEIPLPEDIEKAKWCGDFDRAQRLIRRRMESGKLPFALEKRLELEQEILKRLPEDYCFSEEEGLALIQKHIPEFTLAELRELEDAGAIEWIYIQGKPHFCHSFYDTLEKVYPCIAKRAGLAPVEESPEKQLLNDVIREIDKWKAPCVKLDFREVTFIDSTGIGFILARYNQVQEYGGELSLRNISPSIRRLFALSGIFQIMKVENEKERKEVQG